MKQENERLIIDENTIYELDLECVRRKQIGQEKKKNIIRKPDDGEIAKEKTDRH